MKLSKPILAALAAALLSTPALAAEKTYSWSPYVGVDYQHMNFDYNNAYDIGGGLALDGNTILDDSLNGFNVHVGARPHRNFGVELGYFRTEEASKDTASGSTVGPGTVTTGDFTTKTRVYGFTLDAMGYMPVDEAGRIDLIGTGGVSWSKGKVTAVVPGVGSGSEDESEFGFRVGAGAQVGLTDQVNLRGLVRYQTADFDNIADHAWVYTAGVNYSF